MCQIPLQQKNRFGFPPDDVLFFLSLLFIFWAIGWVICVSNKEQTTHNCSPCFIHWNRKSFFFPFTSELVVTSDISLSHICEIGPAAVCTTLKVFRPAWTEENFHFVSTSRRTKVKFCYSICGSSFVFLSSVLELFNADALDSSQVIFSLALLFLSYRRCSLSILDKVSTEQPTWSRSCVLKSFC